MKKRIFYFLMFTLLITISSKGQDFAPIGAKWYYTEKFAFSGDISYLWIESVGDTILKGKKCNILENNAEFACGFSNKKNYVYYEDSVAYFYVSRIDTFQILYDLNAKQDSTWTIVFGINDEDSKLDTFLVNVNSVSSVTINSKKLKKLDVYYESLNLNSWNSGYNGEIIERIGDKNFLFNLTTLSGQVCDGNYSEGLRCYQDNELGYYSTGIADSCTYTYDWVGIKNQNSNYDIKISPNPTSDLITITTNIQKDYEIILINITGQSVFENYVTGDYQLDLSNYENGIYFILIRNKDNCLYKNKIIKN